MTFGSSLPSVVAPAEFQASWQSFQEQSEGHVLLSAEKLLTAEAAKKYRRVRKENLSWLFLFFFASSAAFLCDLCG
jgi:hypothetical protein